MGNWFSLAAIFPESHLILLLLPSFVAIQILAPLPFPVLLRRFFFLLGFFVFIPVVQFLLKATLKEVNIFHLTTDLIPMERIIKVKTENSKENYVKVEKTEFPVSEGEIVAPKGEKLTETEILFLKELSLTGHFEHFGETLLVQPTIVFAPALFVGTVITLIWGVPIYTLGIS